MNASEVWRALYELDRLEAAVVGKQPCPHCRGKLQRCDYQRHPRGLPRDLPAELACRFSFCCGTCRRRVTPPSARFFGRKVYAATLILLQSALKQEQLSLETFTEASCTPAATVRRWLKWWRDLFRAPGSGCPHELASCHRCASAPWPLPWYAASSEHSGILLRVLSDCFNSSHHLSRSADVGRPLGLEIQ